MRFPSFQSGGAIATASLHAYNFVTGKLIQVSSPQSLLTRYKFENKNIMQTFGLSSYYIMDVSWVSDDVIYSAWRHRGHKDIFHSVTEIKKNTKSHQVRSKSRKRDLLMFKWVSKLVWMWCQSMELIAWKSLWI